MNTIYEYNLLDVNMQFKCGEVSTVSFPIEGCGEVIAIQVTHDALLKGKKVCYYSERHTTSELINMLRVRNFNTYYGNKKEDVFKLTTKDLKYSLRDDNKKREEEAYKALESGEDYGSFAFVGKEIKLKEVVPKLLAFIETRDYDILIYEPVGDFLKPLSMHESIKEIVPKLEKMGKTGLLLNIVAYSRNYQALQKRDTNHVEQDLKQHKWGKGYSIILMPENATADDTNYILSMDNGIEAHHRFCIVSKETMDIPEYTCN